HCEDRAGLPCLHPGQDALDRQERRSEIAFDGGAPAVLRHVLEGPWRGEAASGVRDEDVDRPEVPLNLLSYRLDLGELGLVAREPMPIASVNSPAKVPTKANPWTVNAIPRTVRGRIQVARRPPSRTDAITPSAAAAAPCANPGRKTPKWNAAAERNVVDSTSRNVRIDSAEGISAADGPRCAVDVAITEPPESDCTELPRGASFRA